MYTVDRAGTLRPGQSVAAEYDLHVGFRTEDLSALMPRIGSAFGNEHRRVYPPSSHIELVWEAVRRIVRPGAPSRFECLFATETLAEAQLFRDMYPAPESRPQIFKVARDLRSAFRADMTLLYCGDSVPASFARAQAYWNQSSTSHRQPIAPFWELLVTLPVTIGDRVE